MMTSRVFSASEKNSPLIWITYLNDFHVGDGDFGAEDGWSEITWTKSTPLLCFFLNIEGVGGVEGLPFSRHFKKPSHQAHPTPKSPTRLARRVICAKEAQSAKASWSSNSVEYGGPRSTYSFIISFIPICKLETEKHINKTQTSKHPLMNLWSPRLIASTRGQYLAGKHAWHWYCLKIATWHLSSC